MSLNNDCNDNTQIDLICESLHNDNLNKMDPELWLLDVQQEILKFDEIVQAVRIEIMSPQQSFSDNNNVAVNDDHDILSEESITASIRQYPRPCTALTSRATIGDDLHAVGATLVNNTILVDAELSEQSKNQSILYRVISFVVIALLFVAISTILAVTKLKKMNSTVIPIQPTKAPSRKQFEHVAITHYPNQTIGEGYMEHQDIKISSKANLDLLVGGQKFLELISQTNVNMTVFGQTENAISAFISDTPLLLKMMSEEWYAHSVSKHCTIFCLWTEQIKDLLRNHVTLDYSYSCSHLYS